MNEADWTGSRFLGGGTYGVAGLWCQLDGNDNIVQVRGGVLKTCKVMEMVMLTYILENGDQRVTAPTSSVSRPTPVA